MNERMCIMCYKKTCISQNKLTEQSEPGS